MPGHGAVGDLGGALTDPERLPVNRGGAAGGPPVGPPSRPSQAELSVQVSAQPDWLDTQTERRPSR